MVLSLQKTFKSTIAIQLKQARKNAKLTQKKFAQQIGVTVPTIRQAENGYGTFAWRVCRRCVP